MKERKIKFNLTTTFLTFALTFSLFFILKVYAATTQGFTVTSVSLTNILHPGEPESKTQWLIQLSLNGGGQSLVGVLDNSTIEYQGYTSVYPLQISGYTDPETAFYIIDNINPEPIYRYRTEVKTGSVKDYLIYIDATPAPPCPSNTMSEWDISLTSGWFGLSNSVVVGRVCIISEQVGFKANIPATPNIQFSTHLILTANQKTETLDLSYNQQSATSSTGNVQANWVGSLVTGNAPPDGSQYVAIGDASKSNWIVKSKTDYSTWSTEYQSARNFFTNVVPYTQDITPPECSSIQKPSLTYRDFNKYISEYSTCLNNLIQNKYSAANQYASNLLTSGINIGGNPAQLTTYNGQPAFKIPLTNYFVTNPVVVLRLSGSFIGVVIPLGKPQIVSAYSDCFRSGETGKILIKVKNIGKAQGSFYASLKNCPGIDIKTQPTYSVGVGQTSDIEVQIFSTGANQNINQSCQIEITDYNGGGTDYTSVGICMQKAAQCQPNSVVVQGNSICPCIQIDGVWQIAAGDQCKYCQYGVVSDGKGGWKCASAPTPQTCPEGQVFSKETSQCVNPLQLVGYPSDTQCQSGWPARQGSFVTINEKNYACDIFEVKDPQLLEIAKETAQCFATTCKSDSCHAFCDKAYKKSGATYLKDSDTFKKFAGLYIIYGLGPAAKYMRGYFDAEISCGSGTGECEPKYGYNNNVQQLQCRGSVGQPLGWASDLDMNKNSCIFSDLPAHVNIKVLQTGTCVDYSISLTTLLRLVGYKSNEVYSVGAPCHEYNLVKFPGDSKWTIVDTVGNSPNPLGDTWSWECGGKISHCDFQLGECSNDLGQVTCPSKSEVKGC
jgi:hypothetical protein